MSGEFFGTTRAKLEVHTIGYIGSELTRIAANPLEEGSLPAHSRRRRQTFC